MLPEVVHADSLDWMRDTAERFDAIVTDPPYGLEFMGRSWDGFGTPDGYRRWTQAWAEAAIQVVKPGAHMVVFGAPRLHFWQGVALADAGWEVRDCLMWLFGSGFPKSLNLAGDKDHERGAIPVRCRCGAGSNLTGSLHGAVNNQYQSNQCPTCKAPGAPAPNNGYGTALKPAYEPVILCRSPLAGTVQQTFDQHGTGALHIDAARIPLNGEQMSVAAGPRDPGVSLNFSVTPPPRPAYDSHDAGRWPANVALDQDAAAVLDAEFETLPTGISWRPVDGNGHDTTGYDVSIITEKHAADSRIRASVEANATGPSRFFYTSKATRAEREAGLRHLPMGKWSDGRKAESLHPRLNQIPRRNVHPTVKPLDLMRWLCRLVVPEGGRVLDPFAGSGTTLIAAHQEGMTALGIEREAEYVDIARGRIAHHCAQQVLL